MTKASEAVTKFIEEALRLEVNGRAFFTHAAEITHNELGKKMFLRLAEEEVKHLDVFADIFTSILKSDEWKKQLHKEELKGPSPVIEELVARMKRAEGKGEVEALRIGMELELKAIDFFKQASSETSDQAIRQIFEKIADEERYHYDLLQAQFDSVTGSGFWFDSAEFRMDRKY